MRPRVSARARHVFSFFVIVAWPIAEAAGQHTASTRCLTQPEAPVRIRLPALLDSAGIPGISLATVTGAKTIHVFSFGWRDSTGGTKVDANTLFEAASLSKPIIAYAALKLVDAGKLDLDKPISSYVIIPELANDPRANRITARMILSHTSGLQNERIGNEALAISFDPGSKFQYSGEGYTLLGRVIAQLSRATLDVAIDQLVLRPLGMNRSSFVWQKSFDADAAVGHGEYGDLRRPTRPTSARAPSGLQTTAEDYAKFVSAILDARGLSKKSSQTMRMPSIHVAPNIDWALGWGVEMAGRDTVLWHHGDNSNSGFTAFTLLDPRSKCAIVYFANWTQPTHMRAGSRMSFDGFTDAETGSGL